MSIKEKEFRTIEEQINLLKSRNLIIDDEMAAKDFLERNSYHVAISEYNKLFLKSKIHPNDTTTYLDGANFSEIQALYMFDRKLSQLLLEYILIIENFTKSKIGYCFSQTCDIKNYLLVQNFDHNNYNSGSIKKILGVISSIQIAISQQVNKNNQISAYIIHYGYIPPWVATNLLTFGTLSKLYSILKQPVQQAIVKNIDINESAFTECLKVITECRNKCAHNEVVFKFRTTEAIRDHHLHQDLKIKKDSKRYLQGKQDLFSVVIILKIILTKEDFADFYFRLRQLIEELEYNLHTISIEEIYSRMGFILNWRDILTV
ncbi:hypothetical protein AN643_03730 [Candidatus Epulonipiscioides saccharophilum]|nr:hypothetical protein AN643_03730 [Epulopiscium sp. SCG-B10WGA-EpuloB]